MREQPLGMLFSAVRASTLIQLFRNVGVLKCKKIDFCGSQLLVHPANIFLGPVLLETVCWITA